MQVTAIVVAAGKGTRMGLGFNKVYAELGDKPVLAHSLICLQQNPRIAQIIVVAASGEEEIARRVIETYNIQKAGNVITGGSTRFRSVAAALPHMNCQSDVVLVHDGARPFLSADDLEAVIQEGSRGGGAILATPVTDTIKRVRLSAKDAACKARGVIIETPDRSTLWRALTPQVFPISLFLEAYSALGSTVTDDASLLEAMGSNVKIVEGSPENIKITNPMDLMVAELFLREKNKKVTRCE